MPMNDIQALVYNYLSQKGLNHNAIAGMMGNIEMESNFNPRIIQGGGESDDIDVNGTHGYGLFQYTSADRQQLVKDTAAKMGLKAGDPRAQLETMLGEMGADGIKLLNEAPDAETAARIFHDRYERSADNAEKLAQRGALAKKFAGVNFDVPVGDSKVSIPANFNVEDPNEQLDINTAMSILNTPKRNVADAGMQALQEQLLNQAHHRARGRLAAGFYQDSDQAMMKAAVAKAEEEAKMQNQTTQLTGAGKLAQMIANSKNNNNRAAYASFGALVGMAVNPMQGQYMPFNQAAQLGFQAAMAEKQKQDQIQAQKDMAVFNADLSIKTAAKMHELGLSGGRGGGGGGYSSGGRSSGGSGGGELPQAQRIAGYKWGEEVVGNFGKGLQAIMDREVENNRGFKQSDIGEMDDLERNAINAISQMEDGPSAREFIRRIQSQKAAMVEYMQTKSKTGRELDWAIKK